MYLYNEFIINILNNINNLLCPSKSNSKQIELTVHTSCYWGLRLTLCCTSSLQGFPSLVSSQTQLHGQDGMQSRNAETKFNFDNSNKRLRHQSTHIIPMISPKE